MMKQLSHQEQHVWPWLTSTRISRGFLALLLGALIAGCAHGHYQTAGTSGSITWEATNLHVVEWLAPGISDPPGETRETYEWTLVLHENQGTAVTLTQVKGNVTQFDADLGVINVDGSWSLPPHGEWRLPFSITMYCGDPLGCGAGPALAPWYTIAITGTNAQGQAVNLNLDFRLPPMTPNRQPEPTQVAGVQTSIQRRRIRVPQFNKD